MKQAKWERREKKSFKAKYAPTVDGRSVFLIVQIQIKKAKKVKHVR
jgi:hypothetical protein